MAAYLSYCDFPVHFTILITLSNCNTSRCPHTFLESDVLVSNIVYNSDLRRYTEGKVCIAVAGASSVTGESSWAEPNPNPVDDAASQARVMGIFDEDNNLQVTACLTCP
jgi:hypothetical protein